MIRNTIIYTLFFLAGLSAWGESPEQSFLNRLKTYADKYGDNTPEHQEIKTSRETERQKTSNIVNYQYSMPMECNMAAITMSLLMSSNFNFPGSGEIEKHIRRTKPATPSGIYKLFSRLVSEGKFRIQTGDILFTLSHTFGSYKTAYMMDSFYSHSNLIYINTDTGEPYIYSLTNEQVCNIPLADYLCGIGVSSYLSNFAIYRYSGKLNPDKLTTLVKKTSENISNLYFDVLFHTDLKIENPDEFLSKPGFYYCGEFVAAILNFSADKPLQYYQGHTNIMSFFNRLNYKLQPDKRYYLDIMEKKWRNEGMRHYMPQNFYLSDNFSPVVIYRIPESIKEKFQPASRPGLTSEELKEHAEKYAPVPAKPKK